MNTSPVFEESYKNLNAEQKKAVDTVYGPVMVIAGPGTGKTTLLTLRIANILKQTDASAGSILALTFTESAVSSMRQKLFNIIGTDAYRVHINTFHGFCNDVIRRYPEYFPRIIGSRNIREIEQIKIIREIIEANDFDHIKPFGSPFHYVREAVKAIQSLKRETIDPEAFAKQTEESDDPEGDRRVALLRNSELAFVYRAYEEILTERKLYDFDDMLLDVVRAVGSSDALRATLQERFQFILADEHQDANASQNAVLELLCSYDDAPNLLIVGDEKQAIFRFQGASLENFLYFKRRFPTAEVVYLTENYRSGQHILDAAHSLIIKGTLPEGSEHLRKPLVAAGVDEPAHIRVVTAASEKEEISFVIDEMRKAHKDGVPWGEMALIYRDNKDAGLFAEAFERTEIPFAIRSNVNVLDDTHIKSLIRLLRLVLDPTDGPLLGEVVFAPFFDLSPLDAYKALAHAKEERMPLSGVLSSSVHLKKAGLENPEKFSEMFKKIIGWSRIARTRPFLELFDAVIRETAFVPYVISLPGSADTLKALEVLFEEARSLSMGASSYMLADFLDHIDIMDEHGSTLKMLPDGTLVDAVPFMTAHRSKGLEFERVFIVGVTDGHWGNRRNRSLFSLSSVIETNDDDERRLLYVAITRAKREATLIFPATDTSGAPKMPSQFVEEITAPSTVRETTADRAVALAEITSSLFFAPPLREKLDIAEAEYLLTRFEAQGLSVSALNNYLSCPWRYFFVSLVRVPQTPGASQRFGTMVHLALRLLGEQSAVGKRITAAGVKKIIAAASAKTAIEEREEARFIKKGMRSLPDFWKQNAPKEPKLSLWEYDIETTLPLSVGEPVILRGTIDRIDPSAKDSLRVNVVDYKTGKHKSRNDILGKTKTSTGDFFRQLVFYRILLSLGSEMIAEKGVLTFVERDDKDRYRTEIFDLTDTDTSDLRATVERVVGEIRSFAFWDATCDDRACEYCALARVLREKK